MDKPVEALSPRRRDPNRGCGPAMNDATTTARGAPGRTRAIAACSRNTTRLHGLEFDRLASQTRLGPRAREMARMTLVEGRSMHDVAQFFDTIPQRVRLAVGSIHRVQAALTWGASPASLPAVPEGLFAPLSDFIASLEARRPAQVDGAVIAELQSLLRDAQQRIAGN